ncbi:nuclear transport factor 2 family protein [Allopusillimonas ginsengisoli]|nr:nuclear transport factor 2 family protein [Allopusillimonas ginsengisoli]
MNSEIRNMESTVYRFFRALDARDHAGVAGLMAARGTWVRQGTSLVGPEAVLQALEERDPQRVTAHIVSNLWIEIATETEAQARFYMTAFETRSGQDTPQMLGVRDCVDDLILEDGTWRIWRKESRRILPAE